MEKEMQGERTGKRRFKILVAIDASEMSDLVVKRSSQFAKVAGGSELTIFTVVEDLVHFDGIPDTPLYHDKKEKAEQILVKARKTLSSHDIECKIKSAIGPVGEEIVRFAEEKNFDLIFMGSRGLGGLKRMLLGSVADEVIKHAHCAVTIIR